MGLLFGGRDNTLDLFNKAKVVVLPVPYGRTVSYRKGTEHGPRAILDASCNMELFDEEIKKEIHNIGIHTLHALEATHLRPEEMLDAVESSTLDIIKKEKFPVIIGGEHTVTIGAVKALKSRYRDLSVLYFDAHYDLKDKYKDSKYSHACTARRLVESVDVFEVGVRSLSRKEFEYVSFGHKALKIMTMLDILKKPNWYKHLKANLSDNIYISIDLDVFDPCIMPSVGTPEPGGMDWYGFLEAVRYIIKGKNVVGFDVVELCPIKDLKGPDFMAAKLIYKILGYIFFKI